MLNNEIIDRVKKRYSLEVDEPSKPQSVDLGDFKRLADYNSQNNNPDLWQWVLQQEEVIKAKEQMDLLFDVYVFEIMKPQFVQFCKDTSSDVIKNYVDTYINVSKEYVSPTVKFEEEKKQLQEIIKQQALIIEQNKTAKEIIKI